LRERCDRHGFRITGAPDGPDDLVVSRRTVESFDRREPEPGSGRRRNTRTVTLTVAQYDGRLEVTDPEALRRSLVAGIGPAKAYGCGLLTLAATS